VALALLDERADLVVSASDASASAVDVARANAARLGLPLEVSVQRGMPSGSEGGQFDLVLANLPYVREDEWDGLAPEIRLFEPRSALVSGADGLDAIRSLVDGAPPGTRLALEHAPGQAAKVRALLAGAATHRDLAGRERVTVGSAP
jgi:release factor glutamine methyltransferase